jgi:hypothetical protein
MRPAIRTQIPLRRLFQKRQSSFACRSQFSQHFFLGVQQIGMQWNRRFAPDDPALDQPHWEMESFQKRNRFRYFLCDSVSAADDCSLHRHQVRHQFRGRPDHSSAFGFVFHCSGETESAARKNAVWAQLNFSRMGSRGRMPVLNQELPVLCFPRKLENRARGDHFRASRRQPVQMHAPAAAPALPQTLARRSAALQAAGLQGGRTAQRSLAAPPAIP